MTDSHSILRTEAHPAPSAASKPRLPEHHLLTIARVHYAEPDHWLYGPNHKRHAALTQLFLGHLRVADNYNAQVTLHAEDQSVQLNYIASARIVGVGSTYGWRYLHRLRDKLPSALEADGIVITRKSRGANKTMLSDAYCLTFQTKALVTLLPDFNP